MNERGNAAEICTRDRGKTVIELSTARARCEAMRARYGNEISSVMLDVAPPDCIAEFNGRKIAIELTELVNGAVLAKAQNAKEWTKNWCVRRIVC